MSDKMDFDALRDSYEDNALKWPPPWIVSFSDMMTLLLTFFIFFFSVTTLKELPKVLKELREGEVGLFTPIRADELPIPKRIPLVKSKDDQRERRALASFMRYLKRTGLSKDIELKADQKEIKITIKNPILFATGNSDMKREAQPVLSKMSELFKDNDHVIRIEGHTDNVPIKTDKFPSNWELSSSRAINVIKYFIDEENITATRFEALGYGEFRPAATNGTVAGRAENRRVEIKIIQRSK
ncbi:flagellar motor protein MotB [Thermodesulfobacteriota bacterium]